MRILLLAVLFTLTACTSLNPRETPAPVESVESPPATSPTPERPIVGPPLPTEQDRAAPRGSAPPEPERPAATVALLTQIDTAIAAGELERAAALAERALRITPRDAQTWYTLANIQFQQRRFDDAEGSAQRALSLVGGNDALQRRINVLLGAIRSAG
jgi:hypothetical protein